ncbi:NAD(P)H-hydrate dehydratase [Leucobacter viscericola]|uniref:ADP-dependent (S)-NAD(P)H-hydrate dehydratase n=1 Tax=Leucobacter viscericola TaxID=2714935 RepID=A0A6G7XET3_9MICO|nr:ADP/ATP-dependent (S)-NAD(P)H-hydrate dehydratase [Leucobacter viscericola]QIK63104.1 NAD(P)H-hydrate dehydratase [Leucobacter viscericola]
MTESWSVTHAAKWLRAPGPADDKYRRGVLGVRTGSAQYPGAAVLGVTAAWRSGVGMVRYVPPLGDSEPLFGLPSPAAAVLAAHPETVFGDGGLRSCGAWVIGSGTDPGLRSASERTKLLELLNGEDPVVVDAGALELVGARKGTIAAPAIVTPHRGEFTKLWRGCGLGVLPRRWSERSVSGGPDRVGTNRLAEAALRLAECLGVTVLLKGSVTVAATPGGRHITAGPATPWLASAGTGDVLAGMLGALVATHAAEVCADPELLADLGATAAILHDAAARIAAGDPEADGSGHPITALDVANAIPAAWAGIAVAG